MFPTQTVTLISYLVIALFVGVVLVMIYEINRTKYDVVVNMPLVYVGGYDILIFAAQNLICKLLSDFVSFLITDLSRCKGLY